jgi:hypothetical protein
MADNFDAIRKSSARKVRTPSNNGMRVVKLSSPSNEHVLKLCSLAYLQNLVKSLVEQYQAAVADECFKVWTQEMWDTRKHPANFKVQLDKSGTTFTDAELNFVLKFRVDGIQKKVSSDLDMEGIKESLIEAVSAFGLSAKNAAKFVNEEIAVREVIELVKPLDDMQNDPELKPIADKLAAYTMARPKKGQTTVTVPAITEEESAKLWVIRQEIKLKEGLLDRVFTYCATIEELRALILWLGVVRQVSNFDFGKSDDATERNKRLREVVNDYVIVG